MQTYKLNLALLLLYKLVMDFFYIRYISTIWKDVKWCPIKPNIADETVSWIIYVAILLLIMPMLKKKFADYLFSEYVLLFLLLFSVVPELSICGAGTFSKKYFGLLNIYWMLMFLLYRFSFFEKEKDLLQLSFLSTLWKERVFQLICIVCAGTLTFVFLYYGNGQFFADSPISSTVYEIRAEWSKIYITMPFFVRYIIANASMILCFLLLYLLDGKRYLLAGGVCLIQYMNFSCGAKKIDLFMMILCLVVYVLREYMDIKWVVGLVAGCVLFIIGMYEFYGNWGFMGVGKRAFFLPNMISWCYYDFFRKHLPIIGSLFGIETVSKADVPNIIGLEYGRSAIGTYANSGLFGDAVMMFGAYGAIIVPVLWSLYLFILDKASRNVTFTIKMGIGFCWAFLMQNSYMTTSMLSHGGVMLLVLFCLLNEIKKEI